MSLDAGSEATVVGVGVAALLGSGTGVVKAAAFREDSHSRWKDRVRFARVALDEKTFAELETLRREINEVLPLDFDPNFDPAELIVDPAGLSHRAGKAAAYYRTRSRMERDLVRLRRLGPIAVGGFGSLAVAAVLLTVYYAQLARWSALRTAGLLLLAASAVVLIAILIIYVVLEHRMTSAEILAGTGASADRGWAER